MYCYFIFPGNPITGYKVMLQSLVSHYPEVVYDNFDLITDLLQSYTNPNKMNISIAVMWVLAQAGNFNFKHGLKGETALDLQYFKKNKKFL